MRHTLNKIICGALAALTMLSAAVSVSAVDFADPRDGVPALTGADPYTGEDNLEVPQIRVTTENSNGTELQKDDGYVNASIAITDTDGSVLSDSCVFKVRGNTTAMTFILKKAFTFKFEKKKDVLGMGKAKKWALIANTFDPTQLRNELAFSLADEMGLPYTSQRKYVELWVDGSYRGCYQLFEPVQEGKERVDIDIESNDGKKDFMLEYEAQRVEADATYIKIGDLRFVMSEPEEPTEDQVTYITDTMTDILDTVKNGTEQEIAQKLDLDSFVKFYVLNEYLKTFDFDMSSVFFFYKDGVLYAGPPWDYDLSTGNTNPNLTSSRPKLAYASDGILQKRNIYRYLCDKPWFDEMVKDCYAEYFDYIANISADGGFLDTKRAQYATLFDRNFTYGVYPVNKWTYNYQLQPKSTYEENFNYLKNWCAERHAWLVDHWDLTTYSFLRGDADGDGELKVVDASLIQRVDAEIIKDTDGMIALRSMVTGDELTTLDATAVQRYMAEMPDTFGINENVTVHRLPKPATTEE